MPEQWPGPTTRKPRDAWSSSTSLIGELSRRPGAGRLTWIGKSSFQTPNQCHVFWWQIRFAQYFNTLPIYSHHLLPPSNHPQSDLPNRVVADHEVEKFSKDNGFIGCIYTSVKENKNLTDAVWYVSKSPPLHSSLLPSLPPWFPLLPSFLPPSSKLS